jgi:hypothetical protein
MIYHQRVPLPPSRTAQRSAQSKFVRGNANNNFPRVFHFLGLFLGSRPHLALKRVECTLRNTLKVLTFVALLCLRCKLRNGSVQGTPTAFGSALTGAPIGTSGSSPGCVSWILLLLDAPLKLMTFRYSFHCLADVVNSERHPDGEHNRDLMTWRWLQSRQEGNKHHPNKRVETTETRSQGSLIWSLQDHRVLGTDHRTAREWYYIKGKTNINRSLGAVVA